MIHVLQKTQIIRATPERAWDFFSAPGNLSKITPPEMDFTVLGDVPPRIYQGMMIEYRVRPLFGIPMSWLTEITQVEEGKFFVDEQRVGPYRIWHHEHRFRELPEGQMELSDKVTYQLPLSPLGDLSHPILVAPQLAKIFNYREKAVERIFG